MIGSDTVDLLINQTEGRYGHVIWKKQDSQKYVVAGGESSGNYNIVLDNSGAIPRLTMTRRFSGETVSATDLDDLPGFFKEAESGGFLPNFWIATLLDKVTDGEIPLESTADATMEEGVRIGLFRCKE